MLCRTHLKTDDLVAYFSDKNLSFDDLLAIAEALYVRYFTAEAYDRAIAGGSYASNAFVSGTPWTGISEQEHDNKPFEGDRTLANAILCMRDSMMHHEFQSAIADGDIGRTMNIMSVSIVDYIYTRENTYNDGMHEGVDLHVHRQWENQVLERAARTHLQL